jgi:hypothetical protein
MSDNEDLRTVAEVLEVCTTCGISFPGFDFEDDCVECEKRMFGILWME